MGSTGMSIVNLIDIRQDKTIGSLLGMLKQSLRPEDASEPSVPTLLLYDEKGLKLFEDITYLDEYYLTNAEIETLSKHADRIAARIPAGSRLVELGSGFISLQKGHMGNRLVCQILTIFTQMLTRPRNLRKVDILLQAFERAQKLIEYYALDLSLDELYRTFAEINPSRYKYVSLNALHGTYDDALPWLQKASQDARPICIMTLGSSIGNFGRDEAASFLKGFKDILRPSDFVLVGVDACEDGERVYKAYNDSQNVTTCFYRNGLVHANRLLGYDAFKQDEWGFERIYDSQNHRHTTSYLALVDVQTADFAFEKGQKLHLEDAYKYTKDETSILWHRAGLISQISYGNEADDYHVYLLSPSAIEFSERAREYASELIPSTKDWESLWSAWDTVTRSMIPEAQLANKPIQLRNDLIFYLGHIPAFADILYTKATGAKPTGPAHYASIFERGIDPNVDNPEICHDHSEIPEKFPPVEEIMEYSVRVRSRITESITTGQAVKDQRLGRGLWLAYEHGCMHLETFLNMLLYSSWALPPPGVLKPDFEKLAEADQACKEENCWHEIPSSDVVVGSGKPKDDLNPSQYFCWDSEQPSRVVKVARFLVQSRCISNGEYATFLEQTKMSSIPAGWTTTSSTSSDILDDVPTPENGETHSKDRQVAVRGFVDDKSVRTVFGPVPLKLALEWPVMASYDELAAYAKWADARIPTLEEARRLYEYVEAQNKLKAEQIPSNLISAVNGHLCNNGVEETPPSNGNLPPAVDGERPTSADLSGLFIDLSGRNVAFQNWHPTAVTGEGKRLRGQSDAGGLWEWTSSALAEFPGFKPMDLYPGYTADFFDGKHNIVLGGSWATVPRIAGRKTFVNWYQRNYPYTWATARLVRDLE